MRRLMIDIEALSTRPTAVPLQIGAVLIDGFDLGKSYLGTVSRHEAAARGDMDPHTQLWWHDQLDQKPWLRELVWRSERSLSEVMWEFLGWAAALGVEEIWAQGPQFDVSVIEHAAGLCGLTVPWRYNQVRDLRTLRALYPLLGPERASHHHEHYALHDAEHQATVLVAILRHVEQVDMGAAT